MHLCPYDWQVRLRDHGVLDFDATDLRRQPPVDTTWQQVPFLVLGI
jgi:nuclear pore complex protein Nup93